MVYMASPLTFDPSVVEIFTTLCCGATLLILADWLKLRTGQLAVLLTDVHHVTVIQVNSASYPQQCDVVVVENVVVAGHHVTSYR